MIVRTRRSLSTRAPSLRAGLSLLEVLLALAIFLTSIVAITGLVDFGSDRGQAAAMQTAATRLAVSKMAEVEAGAVDVTTGSNGTFDEEPEWSWTIEAGSPPLPNVYPITVRVTRDLGGRKHEVVLHQFVFNSAMMGTPNEAQKPTTTTSSTASSSTAGTSK